jgi:hypothetical protein
MEAGHQLVPSGARPRTDVVGEPRADGDGRCHGFGLAPVGRDHDARRRATRARIIRIERRREPVEVWEDRSEVDRLQTARDDELLLDTDEPRDARVARWRESRGELALDE